MKRYLRLISIIIMTLMVSSCGVGRPESGSEGNSAAVEVEEPFADGKDNSPVKEESDKKEEDPPSAEIKSRDRVNGSSQVPDADTGEAEGKNLYYINVRLTPEDAYDIFKDKYPRARVKEIELDKEKNSYVYEVEGYENNIEYEIKINPLDGEIIKIEEDYDNQTRGEIKREDLANIPVLLQEAVVRAAEGYSLKDWSVEVENDIIEFDIKFTGSGGKIEYKYNLRSGDLLKSKQK